MSSRSRRPRQSRAATPAQRIGAFGLALLMHLLLGAMLLLGLKWQTQPPVAVQAELFTPPPLRDTAAVPAPPMPTPVRKPEPTPAPRPVDLPTPPQVDIKLEAQKREREAKERQEREAQAQRKLEARKLAEAQARQEAEQRKAQEARKEAELRKEAEQRKAQEARKEADARKLEAKKEAQARAEAEAKKAQDAKKAAEARKLAEAKQEEQAQERSRDDHVKRLLEQAGGERSGGKSGAAVGADAGGVSGAALGSWGSKVSSHIRANTVFQIPPELRGNPKAEFSVTVMPDGAIANLRLLRSSGVPAWDQAAERAIRRADPLPRPPVGAPRELSIVQGPRDE